MVSPATVPSALAQALSADPSRPLVTFYDDATGERIELSVATFDNWVNKLTNLYSDELMLDPGDAIGVQLPVHWQSTVILVAAWTAGLRATMPATSDAALHIVGPDAVRRDEPTGSQAMLATSLRPLGAPFDEPLPPGWLDFAREVPPQPDVLLAPAAATPEQVAINWSASETMDQAGLVSRGYETSDEMGLHAGGRLVTDHNPADPAGVLPALVAPLVTGSSVVLVAHADDATKQRIALQEKATCQLWRTG
ncbi:MAG: TIGR03089 family protein [Nocardioidaceae bacterium]